jgi:hypothetical protein
MMRTTLNLPDDVYEVARSIAHARQISLGDAIADLVRQGLKPSPANRSKGAFPSFAIPADARPITLEQTLAAEDEI